MVGSLKKVRTQRIELNGWTQQYALRGLCYGIPFWFYILPLTAFCSGNLTRCLFTILAVVVCFGAMIVISRNRLVFTQHDLKLPGAFGGAYRFDEIKRVSLVRRGLLIEKATSYGSEQKTVSISNLTKESASQLWALLATKLVAADIGSDVRYCLVHWTDYQPPPVKNDKANYLKVESTKQDHDFNVVIDLNAHRIWTKIAKYIERYQQNGVKVWCVLWLGFPLLVVCLAFSTAVIAAFPAIHKFAGEIAHQLILMLLELPTALALSVIYTFQQFFYTYWPAAITAFLLPLIVIFIFKAEREADSALLSGNGVYLLRQTPLGTAIRKQISWQNLESVTVIKKSASILGKKLDFIRFSQSRNIKKTISIDIPLRALASHKSKEQLLETLKRWVPSIEIDGSISDALAPNEPDSYTELWLSSFSSAPRLEELTPLSPETVLQHHQLKIVSRLASGGQAVAYLATWPQQEQLVVLKETVLPIYVKSARETVLAKFERDAKLLQALEHSQIVKLHDYFVEGHRAFLMLDYIEGMTLASKIGDHGALNEAQAIHLLEQMLDILSYLHGRAAPVVHRDFTPDNLLINSANQITLIDFDVAMIDDEGRKNKATIVGKQNYLPPEQFRGKPTIQSDIYAMGGTLFFALTGQEPEALQVSQPKNIRGYLSEEIDRLVATCTEPDAAKRFKSTTEIQAALQNIRKEN